MSEQPTLIVRLMHCDWCKQCSQSSIYSTNNLILVVYAVWFVVLNSQDKLMNFYFTVITMNVCYKSLAKNFSRLLCYRPNPQVCYNVCYCLLDIWRAFVWHAADGAVSALLCLCVYHVCAQCTIVEIRSPRPHALRYQDYYCRYIARHIRNHAASGQISSYWNPEPQNLAGFVGA